MKYIQRKDENYRETVDEAKTYREAKYLLSEYRLADPSAKYYISQRPCKEWREN